jgi:hypothetical protein
MVSSLALFVFLLELVLTYIPYLDSKLSSVAKYPEEMIQRANGVRIQLEMFRIKDESYKNRDKDLYYRGYEIRDAPITDVNGKYMQAGMFYGAPVFQHSRKWLILRCELPEIPELGITADDFVKTSAATTAKFFDKAG